MKSKFTVKLRLEEFRRKSVYSEPTLLVIFFFSLIKFGIKCGSLHNYMRSHTTLFCVSGNLRLRCAVSLSSGRSVRSHSSCSKTRKQPLRRTKAKPRRQDTLSDLSRYAARQENSGLICWSPT